MIAYKLVLIALLSTHTFGLEFHAVPNSLADNNSNNSNSKKNKVQGKLSRRSNDKQRRLRNTKSGKSSNDNDNNILEADIDDEYDSDASGRVKMIFDDDEFDISYNLNDLPKSCEDDECYFAVRRGKCSNLGKLHRKNNGDVWTNDGHTGFTTSRGGRAAGTIFGITSGYDYDENECKSFLIYGPKSNNRKLGKGSGNGKGELLGCGRLVPKDKNDDDDDYCNNDWSE